MTRAKTKAHRLRALTAKTPGPQPQAHPTQKTQIQIRTRLAAKKSSSPTSKDKKKIRHRKMRRNQVAKRRHLPPRQRRRLRRPQRPPLPPTSRSKIRIVQGYGTANHPTQTHDATSIQSSRLCQIRPLRYLQMLENRIPENPTGARGKILEHWRRSRPSPPSPMRADRIRGPMFTTSSRPRKPPIARRCLIWRRHSFMLPRAQQRIRLPLRRGHRRLSPPRLNPRRPKPRANPQLSWPSLISTMLACIFLISLIRISLCWCFPRQRVPRRPDRAKMLRSQKRSLSLPAPILRAI